MLTGAQITILHNAIVAEPTLTEAYMSANDSVIAAWLNTPVAEKAWLTNMTIGELHDVMDWTEFIGRSVAEKAAFTCMFVQGLVNPSRLNIRNGINDIFSGTSQKTVNFRNAVLTAMQRPMKRAEKLMATGPVSGVYTLVYEGEIPREVITSLY